MKAPNDNPADPFKKALAEATKVMANDPELIRWVHLGETTSFLRAYQDLSLQPLGAARQDQYFAEMAQIGGRLGAHSFTAMNSLLFADLPPFVMCQGQPAEARSMNYEGLRRRGFSPERVQVVKAMHKALYRDNLTLAQAMARSSTVRLGGLECFEGGVARCDTEHDAREITALVRRVTEVARMLGGNGLSETSLAHAREMLQP